MSKPGSKQVFSNSRLQKYFSGAVDQEVLTIEGYANRLTDENGNTIVDRHSDIIPASEWKLDDYRKNPIILFSHDQKVPIGKAQSVEAKEEGLWASVKVFDSKDPEISKVRELIKNDILKAFSVGINYGDVDFKKDYYILKEVDLREISVVAVPANQGSIFSVVKSLADESYHTLASKILSMQGCKAASSIHDSLNELDEPQRIILKSIISPAILSGDYNPSLAEKEIIERLFNHNHESPNDEIRKSIDPINQRLDSICQAIDKISQYLGTSSNPIEELNNTDNSSLENHLKLLESRIQAFEAEV